MTAQPSRGEVWDVSLDPTTGREQAGRRPALVISVDKFNHGSAGLVVILPITTKDKLQPMHVPLQPPDGGLSRPSFVKCEDVRSVSILRLRSRYGAVSRRTMEDVEARVRILLGL